MCARRSATPLAHRRPRVRWRGMHLEQVVRPVAHMTLATAREPGAKKRSPDERSDCQPGIDAGTRPRGLPRCRVRRGGHGRLLRCAAAERVRGRRAGSSHRAGAGGATPPIRLPATHGERRAATPWPKFPVPPAGRDGPERTPVIVEIAGSSGSGKSTLLKEVLRECGERGVQAAAAEDFLLPWLPGVIRRNPTLQNLALDLRGLSETLTLRRHREFLAFAMAVIRRDADRPATGLSAYRGVVRAVSAYRGLRRKLGVHAALAREAGHGPAVLVDEGTIHCAHYVLVHVNSAPRPQDIAAFCRLVPMPELVVYVTAPLEKVL